MSEKLCLVCGNPEAHWCHWPNVPAESYVVPVQTKPSDFHKFQESNTEGVNPCKSYMPFDSARNAVLALATPDQQSALAETIKAEREKIATRCDDIAHAAYAAAQTYEGDLFESLANEIRIEKPASATADTPCTKCNGEGWIIDPDPENRSYYQCECKQATNSPMGTEPRRAATNQRQKQADNLLLDESQSEVGLKTHSFFAGRASSAEMPTVPKPIEQATAETDYTHPSNFIDDAHPLKATADEPRDLRERCTGWLKQAGVGGLGRLHALDSFVEFVSKELSRIREQLQDEFSKECQRFHNEGRKCGTCGRFDLDDIELMAKEIVLLKKELHGSSALREQRDAAERKLAEIAKLPLKWVDLCKPIGSAEILSIYAHRRSIECASELQALLDGEGK